eukprot:tig00000319_g24140.t1
MATAAPVKKDEPPKVRHVKVLQTDMDQEMRDFGIEAIQRGLQKKDGKNCADKDVALVIKKEFETKYAPSSWHVIAGLHFAASITHDTKSMMLCQSGVHKILIWKTA